MSHASATRYACDPEPCRISSVAACFQSEFRASYQVDRYVDVATRGLRIRAHLVRRINQRLCNCRIQSGQAHVQAHLQKITAVVRAEIDLSINDPVSRQGDLLL